MRVRQAPRKLGAMTNATTSRDQPGNTSRRIHPSAALFIGVLLAFLLPFGSITPSCASAPVVHPTGVDLLTFSVEAEPRDVPDRADEAAFAETVEEGAGPAAWLVVAAALGGLLVSAFRGGRGAGWAAGGGLLATLALAFMLLVAGNPVFEAGFEIVLSLNAVGSVALAVAAVCRRRARRRTSSLASTPRLHREDSGVA
jgi:hypothetical protein